MPAFRFTADKSFDANWSAFLDEMESVDPKLTDLLRTNKDKLSAIVMHGDRDMRARGDFNAAIAAALDALVAAESGEES